MLAIVGFASQKGGVGKSTLALATVAAAAGIKVLVADLNYRQQTVARWEERRKENDVRPALHVATFRTLAEAIQASTGRHELLILDAAAGGTITTLQIARCADLIVQPSGTGIDDLDPAIILFHELTREGVPCQCLVMALSRVGRQSEESAARGYVEKAGYTVLPGSIPERAVYRDAHNWGRSVTEVVEKPVNARTDALLLGLFAMITERVKARVRAQKGGQVGTAA